MEASLRVREARLDLTVRRADSTARRGGRVGSAWLPWRENGVRISLPTDDLEIDIQC